MTSPVLISSSASASGASLSTESLSSDALLSNGANGVSSDMKSAVLESAKKLPYQADHQVELLNLQAEIEYLLQQLTMIKQQKHVVLDDGELAHN